MPAYSFHLNFLKASSREFLMWIIFLNIGKLYYFLMLAPFGGCILCFCCYLHTFPKYKWYPQTELQHFNVQVVLLRLAGLNQPVLGIWLELWPDGNLNCNCLMWILWIFPPYRGNTILEWEQYCRDYLSHVNSLIGKLFQKSKNLVQIQRIFLRILLKGPSPALTNLFDIYW